MQVVKKKSELCIYTEQKEILENIISKFSVYFFNIPPQILSKRNIYKTILEGTTFYTYNEFDT